MKLAYEAYDRSGRNVTGVVDAADAGDASESLRRKGLIVTRTTPAPNGRDGAPALGKTSARNKGGRRNLKDLAMFTRQLQVLIATGTPLAQSIGAMERQIKDPRWRACVESLRLRVEEGVSLSDAMHEHPRYFDSVYRSLVTAGESAGNLPAMLDRLAILVRKQMHVRNTVVGAMVYPTLLLSVSFGVLITLFTFVVPRFAGLFETLDVPLPPTTVMLMVVSDVMRGYWWALLLAAGGLGLGAKLWLSSAAGKRAVDTALVRLPMIGPMTRSFATAKIIRLLGVLSESDVPLLEALELTQASTSNVHYHKLITNARDAVTRGDTISSAFSDEKLIAPSVYEAIRHGEQSGQIGPLMLNMADFLDEENDTVIRSLTSIIEPVILIFLGVIVAFVAISIFMPLFDLTAMTGAGK